MHTHTLYPEKHAALLSQDRRDPISGDFLKAGDEVVFCAGCRSAFLKDSWEYLGKTHCGQQETLQNTPTVHEEVKLERVNDNEAPRKPPEQPSVQDSLGHMFIKFFVVLTDSSAKALLIFLFAGFESLNYFSEIEDYVVVFLGLTLIWDILLATQGLGKRALQLVIVKANMLEKATFWQILMRQSISVAFLSLLWDMPPNDAITFLTFSLFVVNLLWIIIRKHSLVSWLTQTRVIGADEYHWNAYHARHKREVQL